MSLKILGIDDAVNTCECCGKTGLKATVVVERDGSIFHYGSVCATKHTGFSSREIRMQAEDAEKVRISEAKKEYQSTPEFVALQNAISTAHIQKVPPGKSFKQAIEPYLQPARLVANRIAAKWQVEAFQFN